MTARITVSVHQTPALMLKSAPKAARTSPRGGPTGLLTPILPRSKASDSKLMRMALSLNQLQAQMAKVVARAAAVVVDVVVDVADFSW